jgi:anti-sigma factor RsiW
MPGQRPVTVRDRIEHRSARRRLNDYVDGGLTARQRSRVERHAGICPECGPLLRALVELVRALSQLGALPERSVAPAVITRLRGDHGPRP